MKILLVGGDGYIGSVFKDFLKKKKIKFISLDRNIYFFNKKNQKKNNDLRNKFYVESILKKVDNVVLLAGLVGDPITKKYPRLSSRINNKGLKELLDQICLNKSLKIKRLIFISTCSNYGIVKGFKPNEKSKLKPLSLYAKDKVEIENYLLSLKNKTHICCSILRFATAFGLSKRMRFDLTVNEFVKTLFFDKSLHVYDPDTWRPYCHVKDFSRAIWRVLKSHRKLVNFEIFNVGSNSNNYTKRDVVKKICKTLNRNRKIIYLKTSKDKRNYNVDFSKILNKLKFKTKYSIEYGINEIVKFLKKTKKLKSFDNFGNYKVYIKN